MEDIKFDQKNTLRPMRSQNTITLPYRCRVVPLHKYQYLIASTKALPEMKEVPEWVYFGGIDEGPFLVELAVRDGDDGGWTAWKYLAKEPARFYEYIKPWRIQRLEENEPYVAGKQKIKTRRQGDIWAYPLSYDWGDVDKFIALTNVLRDDRYGVWGVYANKVWPNKHPASVLDTRHTLHDGTYLARHDHHMTFVEGRLEAPDHTPMVLKGVHYIAQTEHLAIPEKAD